MSLISPGCVAGLLGGGLAALSSLALTGAVTAQPAHPAVPAEVTGQEYSAVKRVDGQDVRLFIRRKQLRNAGGIPRRGSIVVPTLIMRGQYDGIASFQDLSNFFARLPNGDKQFIVMPCIAHTSTRSKNYLLVYHLLEGFFSQPAPVYTGA